MGKNFPALCLTLVSAAHAQLAVFEVASVKINRSGQPGMFYQVGHGGSFTAAHCSLGVLIRYAYDVLRSQIARAPEWVESERYDIAAKAQGDPSVGEIRAMLRNLLEERFRLQSHWETRDGVVYSLEVSKAGKLRPSAPGDCPSPRSSPAATVADAPCGALRNTPGHTQGYKMTAVELAGSLSYFLGRRVLDKTGLTGRYDIELQWSTEEDIGDKAGPSIFTALREQLGLKLESAKEPVQTLVIDHVERPAEN